MNTVYVILADNGKGANVKIIATFRELHWARTHVHCLKAQKNYKNTRFQIIQQKVL